MEKVKNKKNKSLTSRQIAIIKMIADSSPEAITLGSISERLDISSRTVLRELDVIEHWLDENDFQFTRKPGVGLAIHESAENIILLKELLNLEQTTPIYSKKERRRYILGELLCSKEPIKLYVFKSTFKISDATLSNDLDAVEQWLKNYNIILTRKPGVGMTLNGSEADRRQAIANAAFEFTDEGELLDLLRGVKQENFEPAPTKILHQRLFNYIEPQSVAFIEKILRDTESKLNIKYTDSGYMALVVHLSLSIHRLINGEKIEMDKSELDAILTLPECSIAEDIAKQISSHFNVQVPIEEIGFITMHLSSARIFPTNRSNKSQIKSINTRQIVLNIVDYVEKQLNLPFHTCTRMIDELTSHMDSMISRLSMNIHLDNDQVETLQKNYPTIYNAVEKACEPLKSELQIRDISSSEIAFVAMHFVAASETLQVEQKRVVAAVVCPSGMGASRMLSANIMRSFHNIEIRQILSAFSLSPDKLRENGIDLVISTVPLKIDFPFICVNPIPQAQDTLLITKAIEEITSKNEHKIVLEKQRQAVTHITTNDIKTMTNIGQEILQILQHFAIKFVRNIKKSEDLLGEAAGMFADSMLTRRIIGNDLAQREMIASTFLPEMQIHLLHCRTAAIEHCRFGFLGLDEPMQVENGVVSGAVILLSPLNGGNEFIEVISCLSILLAENNRFLQALFSGDLTGGKALAEETLVKYYENQILRIGDGKV